MELGYLTGHQQGSCTYITPSRVHSFPPAVVFLHRHFQLFRPQRDCTRNWSRTKKHVPWHRSFGVPYRCSITRFPLLRRAQGLFPFLKGKGPHCFCCKHRWGSWRFTSLVILSPWPDLIFPILSIINPSRNSPLQVSFFVWYSPHKILAILTNPA